jgi:hypothetical protein
VIRERAASVVACLLALSALLLQSAPRARAEAATCVLLESSEPLDPALSATLAELLSRIGVRLVRSAEGGAVVARVRIEPSDEGAWVSVEDTLGRGLSVRREVTRTGSEALFRETLAHVVLSEVEPLTDARPPPPEPVVPAPEPPLVPSPPTTHADALDQPAHRSAPHAVLGARGGPLWLSPGQVGASFNAGVGIEFSGKLRPALVLEGGALWPEQVRVDDIEAELRLGSLRLAPRLGVLHGEHMGLDLGITGGADIASLVPQHNPQGTRSFGSRRVQPVAGGFARLAFSFTPALRMFTGVGLDVDFAPRRWVVAGDQGETTLAALARLRPWAQLGLEWVSR